MVQRHPRRHLFIIDWKEIKKMTVNSDANIDEILRTYKDVFSKGLGKMKDRTAHLNLKDKMQRLNL